MGFKEIRVQVGILVNLNQNFIVVSMVGQISKRFIHYSVNNYQM